MRRSNSISCGLILFTLLALLLTACSSGPQVMDGEDMVRSYTQISQDEAKKMITAFCEGLEAAGHEWDVYDVCKMNIHGCLACEYCHTKGDGQCVQKDDMQNIYHRLQEAEMLVIASPIYYHGLSGQLKCTIDRFYAAAYPNKPPKLKKVAFFTT